jgi:hypothetical protein
MTSIPATRPLPARVQLWVPINANIRQVRGVIGARKPRAVLCESAEPETPRGRLAELSIFIN